MVPIMPSQIIEVSSQLFDSLLRSQASIRGKLWQAGFDIPKLWRRAEPRSILFEADIDRYGLGHRPILQDKVAALAILAMGGRPHIWPRPLPDDRTVQLLAILQPILESAEGLSAHECLELAEAFEAAREARTADPGPMPLLAPSTKRQRRLRTLGLHFSRSFCNQLTELDRAVTHYRDQVQEADLEECVAALSSHAELGVRLRLRPGSEHGDSRMGLLTGGRRSSLEALMETVTALSDATLHALARHAPYSGHNDLPITATDLAHWQSIITNSAHRHTRNPWRTGEDEHSSQSRREASRRPLATGAAVDGAQRWLDACDPRRWVNVHPLVATSILHLEFIRLSPFTRANRRVGRVLFQAQLYEAGWPVLPWHVAFERGHDGYLDALEIARAQRCFEPFIAFMLRACDTAVSIGKAMVSALEQERELLIRALASDGGVHEERIREYAEALLSGVFLEGLSSLRGISHDRELLGRMHELGHLDRIRSPIGAVFSSPVCRDLMKALAHR